MNSQHEMNTVLVTAYAKAPTGSAMYEIYKHAGIVLEIDPTNHSIVDVEFTFITDLAKDFIKRLVIGYNLSNGVDELVKRIEEHYFAPSVNSVIVALKAAHKRYFEKINQLENKK
ncbi:DUF3870 domain-containing protein [Neobacillus rhizophilus]|nr:DUF3870 domain-containing protein [Neobacillus rhizophilus]